MPLIKCPSCDNDVSDKAVNCPRCGHPFQNTTIQLTNKKWKAAKLVAWILILGGLSLISSPNYSPVGFAFLSVGIITLIVSKFGAWWSNK